MAKFELAYEETNKNEGGASLSLHPEDSGNWTGGKVGLGQLIGSKYGISAPVLSSFLRKTPTTSDMRDLPEETAMVIYRKDYWNQIHGDELFNQDAANSLYDSAVNMGVTSAIRIAQKALGITETGKMDTYTINKLNNK
jgi:lysozyme family protein